MDATAYDAAVLQRRKSIDLAAIVRAAATETLNVLLLFAALFFLIRRLSGALVEPLSAPAMIGVGIAATLTALAARMLSLNADSSWEGTSISTVRDWLPRVCLPILALAISLPGSSLFGLTVLWLMVFGEEALWWRKRPAWRTTLRQAHPRITAAPKADVENNRRLLDEPPAADWLDPSVAQRIVYRHGDEREGMIVEGRVRAKFSAGQQTAFIHVAFCPPFDHKPQVEVEPLDGPACEIRPSLVLPWGVRWEIKLAVAASEPAAITLGFFAAERPLGVEP